MAGERTIEAVLAEADWLRRLARSLTRDAHRAEDCAQETLASALDREPPVRPRAWLARVLRNRLRQDARARARRAHHEGGVPAGEPAPSAHDLSARLELQRLVLEAVQALEEPYRAAIVARFLDGLPPRAIARRAGVPVKTVGTRLERGLAKLRARLDGRCGGRAAWLQALLPFAQPWWSPAGLIGGVDMATKTKVAAGIALAVGALWVGGRTLGPPREGAPRSARGGAVPAASAAQVGSPGGTLGSAPLATPPDVASAGHARSAPAPAVATPPAPSAMASAALARLAVRVVKRRTGLAPSSARLTVTDGSPREEDEEDPLREDPRRLAEGRTDPGGQASLVVPAGMPLWLSVDPPGREQLGPDEWEKLRRTAVPLEPLEPGEERALHVELEHGSDRVLLGQVVAAEDGRPLPGARVQSDDTPRHELASDAQGRFELAYSSWAPPPHLYVFHPGYSAARLRPQWLDQVPGVPVVVALTREATVVARVTDAGAGPLELAARGEPLLAARVELDARGQGELGVPAETPLELELRAGETLLWRAREPWTLAPGERRELVVALGSGALVLGTLRDPQGRPLADRQVLAVPARGDGTVAGQTRYLVEDAGDALSARTDSVGRFELPSVPAGGWWLGPSTDQPWWQARERDEEALAPSFVGLELAPGDAVRRVELVAHLGLWIEGRVEDEDRRGLARAHVRGGLIGGDGDQQALTDDTGAFRLGPLVPGEHHLQALGGDGVLGWPGAKVIAPAGARDVLLVLPTVHSIGGRVVDREGRGVDAHVHLLRRNGSLGQSTSQSEPGAFRFVGLEPGIYSVQAEGADGRVAVREVVLAEGGRVADVALVLEEGTRIGVRHALARSVRCGIFADGVLAADATLRPGAENFETVPAGRLRVELYAGEELLAVRELVGRAGRVESVAFEE
ncbi:MAG TPA: sigma-70 family RNA polymerase sigma factor [Planctomycetota bacterium]